MMTTSINLLGAGVSSILVVILPILALALGCVGGYFLNRVIVGKKIQNSKLDVGYIDGANHSYEGKENICI